MNGARASLKRALKATSPFYICSLIIGFIFALLFPGYSQSFVEFSQRGTVSGALLETFIESKNPLMLVLSIFLINFVIAGFGRFLRLANLLYHVDDLSSAAVGLMVGFLMGAPTVLSYLSDFSSFGWILLMLMFVLENLGFITTCAIGYMIGKESQEGLSRNDFIKIFLLAPIHLKDPSRRLAVKRGLIASIPWILLSMAFFILGAIFETLLIIYFR